jgi:hypothetical protein
MSMPLKSMKKRRRFIRDLAAKALQIRLYHQRVVPNKKTQYRRREKHVHLQQEER